MVSQESNLTESEHARRVREMFAGIAGRYDLLNHLLSGNVDRHWRRVVARELQTALSVDGARALDVACGTGDLAFELAGASGVHIIATDFCHPMLEIAVRKCRASRLKREVSFVEGDAMNLPFPAQSFDVVTIAFGLRNLSSVEGGLKELWRTLRPGGRAAILEFSSPVIPGLRSIFQFYFRHVLPRIGGLLSGSRSAYEYLPDSVARFPDQKRLADLMREVGFESVKYQNLTAGIAALHQGVKSSDK